MNHLTEEQLILHYYGEDQSEAAAEAAPFDALAIEQHLEECGDCRTLYGSVQRVLNIVDSFPVPETPADYGAQVWQRIEPKLPARRRFVFVTSPWRWAAAGLAFAGLLMGAFLAGRTYPGVRHPNHQIAAIDEQGAEGVLRAAVVDYLDRSQIVLVELANAAPKGTMDISEEQQRAEDLVTESRLYRQTATSTGDARIASLLDQLERVLIDIRNSPSQVTPEELAGFQQRLESEGILFKIRVLGSHVRNQEPPVAPAAGQKL